jgi:acetyl esterase/lipase
MGPGRENPGHCLGRQGLNVVRGMVRFLLLGWSAALAAWSLLTLVKARNVPLWKLAIAATEFGHYLAVLAIITGSAIVAHAIVYRGSRPAGLISLTGAVLAAAATVLFFRPLMRAPLVANALSEQFQAAFGIPGPDRPIVSGRRAYFPPRQHVQPVSSHVFAHAGTPDALTLDLYRAASTAPAACVIIIHGGGWDAGDRHQLPELNHFLAQHGYAVAAISYRLAPKHRWPAQREDALAAISWLKAHADELGIDGTRLVLLGRSAGGQIATAVAYGTDDPAIRGVVALYAPHDLPFVWSIAREDDVLNSVKLLRQYLGGPPDGERATLYQSASGQLLLGSPRASPVPPTLLLHGTLDELVWVEHSRRLTARLAELGAPHAFIELPWATHAFDFNLHGPAGQIETFAMKVFLAAVTRPAAATTSSLSAR